MPDAMAMVNMMAKLVTMVNIFEMFINASVVFLLLKAIIVTFVPIVKDI